jgi:hypothetical protein
MEPNGLVSKHGKAIAHLRTQKELDRLGLVFGAGISKDFRFPTWDELIRGIAAHDSVDGEQLLKSAGSKTSISQILFQNYKNKESRLHGREYDKYDKFSAYVQAGWHKIIHEVLYKNVPQDENELTSIDSYLFDYLDIIREIKLTVTYNFDDTIQRLMAASRTSEERNEERGYRTVWNADIQLYPQKGVIYHPNGFLPHKLSERTSEDLIFLDDSFGDQLIDSVAGHYSVLSNYFSQNTCIFVGLSLEDATLKHLLRKCATAHPGHVHYYIYYMRESNLIDVEARKAIVDANFEVYNLVTLFLDKNGIKNLAKCIKYSDEVYAELCDRVSEPTSYKYFLTGSVSVGKSTAVSRFRSLTTHDEWLETRIEGMEKDPSLIADQKQIEKIDQWVADQWRKKNFSLAREVNHGIHIIDRCPLDSLAFTPPEEWTSKAKFTREIITPAGSTTSLVDGTIILLLGEPAVMEVRALKLQKKVTEEDLNYRQNLLKIIYGNDVSGVIWLDTREKSANKVAKEVSKIIHLDEYVKCQIQERLRKVEIGEINVRGGRNE